MKPDLIEEITNFAWHGDTDLSKKQIKILHKIQKALFAPMPDDVAEHVNWLQSKCTPVADGAADMLERLQRLLAWQIEETKSCDVFIKKLEQRIEELEDMLQSAIERESCNERQIEQLEAEKEQDKENRRLVSMVVENFTDEDKARIRAALAERNE